MIMNLKDVNKSKPKSPEFKISHLSYLPQEIQPKTMAAAGYTQVIKSLIYLIEKLTSGKKG